MNKTRGNPVCQNWQQLSIRLPFHCLAGHVHFLYHKRNVLYIKCPLPYVKHEPNQCPLPYNVCETWTKSMHTWQDMIKIGIACMDIRWCQHYISALFTNCGRCLQNLQKDRNIAITSNFSIFDFILNSTSIVTDNLTWTLLSNGNFLMLTRHKFSAKWQHWSTNYLTSQK